MAMDISMVGIAQMAADNNSRTTILINSSEECIGKLV